MKHRFVYIFVLVLVINSTIGRVYYVDNSNSISGNDPIYPVGDNVEQSSRDLDLSFSAGDFTEGDSSRPVARKVYAYGAPELRQFVEYSKDTERPAAAYYRISEVPPAPAPPPAPRRSGWGEIFYVPERNRKLVKLNNGHKGEVLLELRVTANNDGV